MFVWLKSNYTHKFTYIHVSIAHTKYQLFAYEISNTQLIAIFLNCGDFLLWLNWLKTFTTHVLFYLHIVVIISPVSLVGFSLGSRIPYFGP